MAKPKPKPKPLPPVQQATRQIQQILAAQEAATRQAYADKGASAQAAYGAAAQMQQGVAPAIEKTYGEAASREAVMAKGFADGQKIFESQAASASNDLLAKNNSPQQVKASGAGDILATLGHLGASGLNQQGAAFSAAAQFLPSQSRNLGIDAVKAAGNEGAAAIAGFEAKRPELVSAALQQILEGKRADRATSINEWYLKNALRKTGADITGIDPLTGEPTVDVTAANAAAAAKGKATRQKAVSKRNDATADAFIKAGEWVESQLAPGTALTPKGQVPIESHTVKRGKETIQYYVKKGGGTTANIKDAETKTVYDEQPIPKKQYDQLYKSLSQRLSQQLRRYGYKRKQISEMADDILSDYFAVVGGEAPDPTVATKTGPPATKR